MKSISFYFYNIFEILKEKKYTCSKVLYRLTLLSDGGIYGLDNYIFNTCFYY